MKSAMKRAAGGVALTMVLIRGFCGGGSFFGLLRNRMPTCSLYFLHVKLDYGMANNFSSRRSFELIFLPTGSYSSG